MNKPTIVAILVSTTLAINAQDAMAEEPTEKPEVSKTTVTTVESSTDWGDRADKDGRSKLGMSSMKLPGKTKVMKSTTEISQTIDIKMREKPTRCESDIDLEYYQKNTDTEVRTLFTSDNCPQFDATYQLNIMYFNAEGEIKRIVVDEQWPPGRREQLRKTYAMEPDSELKRVSSRVLSCTCEDNQ